MKGELTFDKSSQNVSLLLYSVLLIHKYGKDDSIRRNYDSNSFVERMASFIGTKAYNKEGREERTIFNKSLYAQYYGFITRFKDSENKEWLQLTQRGRLLLPFISEDENESSCYSRFFIKPENRRYVQDMLWTSAVFDSHGKHNAGAQTSNTDVDPLGVIFRCIFSLGYASNDEICYAIFGLNKGDSGNESINKGFDELVEDIKVKRENQDYDYSVFFKQWGVVNKVGDAKVINILADPNFDIITKKDNADGVECNYLSDSCTRFLSHKKIISEASFPMQMIIYSKSNTVAHKWIYETVLGRYNNPSKFCIEISSNTYAPESTILCEKALNLAIGNPGLDFHLIVEANNEADFAEKLEHFLPLIERNGDLNSKHFGSSINSIQGPSNTTIIFPSNLHLLAILPMSDTISTNPIFDAQFKRLNVEDSSNISLPEGVSDYSNYIALLLKNYNLVLTGAPGTGKTFLAKQIAAVMVGNCKWSELSDDQKKQISFVQFHPSYDYTDFVEGLRPDGKGDFIRTDGAFKEFCKNALTEASTSAENAPEAKYVFIIDEINRGELSKIFGELFFSIDPGYRGEDGTVQTQYQNLVPAGDVFAKGFYVPKNVYIIGTMNDIDRGVEAMDFAIRRRFAWREITADDSASSMGITGIAKAKMDALNQALLDKDLSTAFFIGGAYFRKVEGDDFEGLWNYHLKGIVSEYFRGDPKADESIEYVYNAYKNVGVAVPAETKPQVDETEEDS